jgi:pilus assembly protein CpaF
MGNDKSAILEHLKPVIVEAIGIDSARQMTRRELADEIRELTIRTLKDEGVSFNRLEQRDLVTSLINEILAEVEANQADAAMSGSENEVLAQQEALLEAISLEDAVAIADRVSEQELRSSPDNVMITDLLPNPIIDGRSPQDSSRRQIEEAKIRVQPILIERIDVAAAAGLPRSELARQVTEIVGEILFEERQRLNSSEQRDLVTLLINDMMGLGPLEPLLADESITDIMVNGPLQVYVERKGKLVLSDVRFRDNQHVMNIATRIVSQIGRRIDETSPLVDARLADGSRVNIIIPPLAIDGPSISIRKFSKQGITLDLMARQANISPEMATLLKIAGRAQLNILISGGTGSGKTTLLNAMSQLIDHGERIVTIEDAAELQLQQPHVVRLETRPANLEGEGEITMRDLLKNSLRMRPDRIILGEVRGHEAVDMLQAMNTGHEGSMCTVHANKPREALTRIENMVGMAGINLPSKAVRTQIAAALDLIVQVSRMRDGMRRVTSITEVTGMEGDVLVTQELFSFQFEGENPDGSLKGSFRSAGLRPHFTEKAEYFGLDKTLLSVI